MAFMPIWKDGVKMIIKSIMTDEDRKALEYMLSLEYAMPYQLLKTKNNRRKIIYIMTPVLFLLSIGCYFVKSYPMFYVEMGISIIALIWIIWFQSKGKNLKIMSMNLYGINQDITKWKLMFRE